MAKSAIPEVLHVTEKEFKRLMRFARDNDLTLRGNATASVITNSLDNWWAFLMTAEWRSPTQKKITVSDLMEAPVGAVIESADERRVRKTSSGGWIMLDQNGNDSRDSKVVNARIVMAINPVRFVD